MLSTRLLRSEMPPRAAIYLARTLGITLPISGLLFTVTAAVARAQPATRDYTTECWSADLGAAVRSSPAVTETTVYVGTADGYVVAIDRRLGVTRWRFNARSPVDGTIAVDSHTIFLTVRTGDVYALSVADGSLRWRHRAAAPIPFKAPQGNLGYAIASPVVADTVVYATGPDGRVVALRAATGGQLWSHAFGASIWTSPVVHGDAVYVAVNDGRLYALDRRSGIERWHFATDGAAMDLVKEGYDRRSIQSTPTLVGDQLIFGSRDGNVYAVDTSSGRERWRASYAPSWVSGSPTIDGHVAYVTTSDAKVIGALDVSSGHEIWRTPVGARVFPAVRLVNGVAVVGTDGGELVALDAVTGQVRWRADVGGAVQGTAAVFGSAIYFGSDAGTVDAIAIGSAGYPALAVFWDSAYARETVPGSDLLRAYLAMHGYDVLDASGLTRFLTARSRDQRPSVVVFAQDVLPVKTAASPADSVLLRQYLHSGGKVVWLGNLPRSIGRDSLGRVLRDDFGYPMDFDPSRSATLLGARYDSLDLDAWPTTPTALGRRWGLTDRILAGISLDTSAAGMVLETTQAGRAAAWVHTYGGPDGTGFVFLGGGGVPQELPIPTEALASIRRVAEYGVLRQPNSSACR